MSVINPSAAPAAYVCNDITNPFCVSTDPVSYTFFGWMGVAAALVFANFGAAYGTAKSGIGIGSMSVTRPNLVYKSLISVVMAGILGIYGLIVSVILVNKVLVSGTYGPYQGFKTLASGLCCGLSSLASGYAIGVVGEHSVRANAINEDFYVGMILILIFAEAIGLFGLIVAIILS
jgi:V-type H+-transporting ATPase proteolipid subunit